VSVHFSDSVCSCSSRVCLTLTEQNKLTGDFLVKEAHLPIIESPQTNGSLKAFTQPLDWFFYVKDLGRYRRQNPKDEHFQVHNTWHLEAEGLQKQQKTHWVPLQSVKNRKGSLQFARAHQNWTIEGWNKVAWGPFFIQGLLN